MHFYKIQSKKNKKKILFAIVLLFVRIPLSTLFFDIFVSIKKIEGNPKLLNSPLAATALLSDILKILFEIKKIKTGKEKKKYSLFFKFFT